MSIRSAKYIQNRNARADFLSSMRGIDMHENKLLFKHVPTMTSMLVLAAASLCTPSQAAAGPVEYETEPLYSGFGGSENDDFGFSLAIDGSFIAIGARFDDIDGEDSGAVYVYNRLGRNFLYAPFASDVGPGDLLGYSIAIDNNLLYATAPLDEVDGVPTAGSVYVF
ncbi:MAG: FG-GAP repeat protein, partial [Phycisphaerales bacterium]|nr:FG-GAP repeat protein [Phycisphaerales bacterium]